LRVFITGAAGFIGSHVLEVFAKHHEVLGIDNFDSFYSRTLKLGNLQETALQDRVREGDLLDTPFVEQIFIDFQPELVIHLAARAGVRPSIQEPASYMRHNVEATTGLYSLCQRYGVNAVVLASSSSVYGSRNSVPFREDEPVIYPQSPYAASKIACELVAGTFARLYGIRSAILRFFTVYGPRQRPDLAIASFTQKIFDGQPISIFGDGSTERDFTYIDDVIDGVQKAAQWVVNQQKGHYDTFNLGENSRISLAHMIELLEAAIGTPAKRVYLEAQLGDVPKTCADISKAKRILGYQPRVNLDEGLKKYVEWFQKRREETK